MDYTALVSNPVSTVRERVEREGIDPEKVLQAEKANRDREEIVRWLRGKIERQDMEESGEEETEEQEDEGAEKDRDSLFEEPETVENPFE
ncbi:MAG: hypothetical protein SVW02_02335 [Candidatus Nanohaloarchaea archaeon]|nr:hypothetical protein [Candidatus Nanohaloarchaea archaeon]